MKHLLLVVVALGLVLAWRLSQLPRGAEPIRPTQETPMPRVVSTPSARTEVPAPRPQAAVTAGAPPARARSAMRAPADGPIDPRFTQANELIARGRFDAAERVFDDILRKEPQNSDALVEMGVLFAELRNQPDKAIPYFRRAIEVNPESAPALDHLLGATTRAAGVAESASTLRDLYSQFPDSAALNGEMGRMSASKGSTNEALAYFEKAYRKGASVDTQLDYAGALMAARQPAPARDILQDILKKDPSNEPARALLSDLERASAE